MAKAKITKRSVDALKPGETLFDTELRGFMVRARGASKTFAVKYSVAGRQHIYTLGRFGDLTPEQARSGAQDALNRANKARADKDALDPQSARETERRTPKQTLGEICLDFVQRHAKKNRSWRETERILNRHVVSAWGRRPIASIRRTEVVALLDNIEDCSGAAMATAVLAQVRKMFNWHATRDEKFNSPIVKGMARIRPKDQRRDRVLNDEEIRVVWQALESMPPPYRQLVRFLLLSAQRKDEAANLRGTEIDANSGVWVIPAERYKTKKTHSVPLSPFALSMLAELPMLGDYLFTTRGAVPFGGFSKSKRRLDANIRRILQERRPPDALQPTEAQMAPWVLHDLRRTAKTLMTRVGIRPDISERVLGHVIAGVEGTYDRHEYLEERRHAVLALATEVKQILDRAPGANVVRLAERRELH